MDWTGITNENDFYSAYFFADGLQGAINERIKGWADEDAAPKAEAAESGRKIWHRPPPFALRQAAGELQETLDELTHEKRPLSRLEIERRLNSRLLGIFDLPTPKKNESGEPVAEAFFPNGDDGMPLPLLGALYVEGDQARPVLWVLEASSVGTTDSDGDPLNWRISKTQFDEDSMHGLSKSIDDQLAEDDWLDLLEKEIFKCTHPPRWIILAAGSEWILIDSTKWAQKSCLRFDWQEIVSRRSMDVMNGCAALLSAQSMSSIDGRVLLETIDEAAHKQAYGVSESLKKSLREAIELLGNEAAPQLIEKSQVAQKNLADVLTIECLRYMYRILFLLFVESRQELHYAPIENPAYATGYSFESLRDLELIPLVTDEDRNGRYIHDSITKLFRFFGEGTPRSDDELTGHGNYTSAAFEIAPLRGALFDASRTPHLNKVVFTNKTLQAVIRKMSLSESSSGKGKRRGRTGRISYAHLGINQLGAVYEALLSYRGFFAKEDLYEVCKADSKEDEFETGYFVTAKELQDYEENEKVYVENENGEKTLKVYPKGTFIYRLTGREREKSASYYTPEVLTQCVVKYGLKEYFETVIDKMPDDKSKAEKILSLKICEPAMGSAAFLNEAINQLAVKYMAFAQKAKGEALSMSKYGEELQKVKMYLADNCVFGVDLNPVAVELAEVSLWLNALSSDRFVPWFGLQLHAGNSLIGCRRTVYSADQVMDSKGMDAETTDLGLKPLGEKQIWQFLVPNPGMANYKDADVKAIYSDAMKTLAERRKKLFRKVNVDDISLMVNLSEKAELLWRSWAKKLAVVRQQTSDPYEIYGHVADSDRKKLSYREKNELVEKLRNGDGSMESGEFMRLKMAMNYWCALWFWPIDKAAEFPSLDQFLADMGTLLSSEILDTTQPVQMIQTDLFSQYPSAEQNRADEDESGRLSIDSLTTLCPKIAITEAVAERLKFFHWPLVFADIFMPENEESAGFDLTFGNPPWRVPSWNSGAVIGDYLPYVLFRKDSASKIRDRLLAADSEGKTTLDRHPEIGNAWRAEFEESIGTQSFLGAKGNYPEIQGSSINLFKLFLPLTWRNSSQNGVEGFVHPLTNFTETKGISLRKNSYSKLRYLFQFQNELLLFPIHDQTKFSVSIYGDSRQKINAKLIMNVFHPKTIDDTFISNDNSVSIGIKDEKGEWNLKGQKDRLVNLNDEAIKTIANVFSDNEKAPVLPNIHSGSMLKVLKKFADIPTRIRDLGEENYCISSMWHETGARKDGTIEEFPNLRTKTPHSTDKLILNGPHLSVGNPYFKTPNLICRHNLDWFCIDLELIPDDFIPRTKYQQLCSDADYATRQVTCKWDKKAFDQHLRVFYREMVGVDSERSLTSAIYPEKVGTIFKINSICFKNDLNILNVGASFASIPFDAYVRMLGKGDLQPSLINSLPLIDYKERFDSISARILALNCLTNSYNDIWRRFFKPNFTEEKWANSNIGINQDFFRCLTNTWSSNCGLRSDLIRRQALVEIDVLTAQAMGLDLQDLLTLYRMRFRVLRSNEADTWYDQNGRIVFTPNSLGLAGVGLPRKKRSSDAKEGVTYRKNGYDVGPEGLGFEDIKDMTEGVIEKTFPDVSMSDTPVMTTVKYVAPFFKMDREKDYEVAWRVFEERFGKVDKPLPAVTGDGETQSSTEAESGAQHHVESAS